MAENDWGELRTLPIDENWYSLGLKLGIKSQELDIIQQRGSSNPFKYKVEMFRFWLRGHQEIPWDKLINALYAINEIKVLTELLDHLNDRPSGSSLRDGHLVDTKQMDAIREEDAKVKKQASPSCKIAPTPLKVSKRHHPKHRHHRVINESSESDADMQDQSDRHFRTKKLIQRHPIYDHQDIKKIILTDKVRMRIVCIGVTGLPTSGKSTLVKSFLNIGLDGENPMMKGSFNGISMCEAVRWKDKITGQCQWAPVRKEDAIFVSVAYALIQRSMEEHNSSYLKLLDCDECFLFDNPDIDTHFKQVLEGVRRTISEDTCPVSLRRTITLVNLMDIGHNRLLYEALPIFASDIRNFLLLNVLNLKTALSHLLERHKVAQIPEYVKRNDHELLNIRSTLAYYAMFVFASRNTTVSRSEHSALLVGTHADLLNREEIAKARRNVQVGIMARAHDFGPGDDIYPQFVTVNAQNRDQVRESVQTVLDKLIDKHCTFEREIPLSWIFLRTVLYSMKKMYMKKCELMEYANKCGLKGESEVGEFLELFKDVGSILYFPNEEYKVLHDNVILDPVAFINGMDKLYYNDCEDINDDSLKCDCEVRTQGFLSHNLAHYLWPKESDFYLQVLETIHLIAHVPFQTLLPEIKCEVYFVPTLRPHFYAEKPSKDSSSLIIRGESFLLGHLAIFKQSDFLLYLLRHYKGKFRFVKNKEYNVLHFQWCDPEPQADVYICFIVVYAEIDIQSLPHCQIRNPSFLYGVLKTATIEIFGKSGEDFHLGFICPHSDGKEYPDGLHFLSLNPLAEDGEELYCNKCQRLIPLKKEQRHWLSALYQGPQEFLLQDGLSIQEATELAQKLSNLTETELQNFAYALGFTRTEINHVEESQPSTYDILFSLFLRFRQRKPITAQKFLAQVLSNCGYYDMAVKLRPKFLTEGTPTTNPLSMKELAIISQYILDWEVLAEQLNIPPYQIQHIKEQHGCTSHSEQCYQMLRYWETNRDACQIINMETATFIQSTQSAKQSFSDHFYPPVSSHSTLGPEKTRRTSGTVGTRGALISALKKTGSHGQKLVTYLETGHGDILFK